jgi:hypothetical protein
VPASLPDAAAAPSPAAHCHLHQLQLAGLQQKQQSSSIQAIMVEMFV